ncbi:hypothetical protein P689_12268 [Candidatus Riesia pediculischaeffi PTSU]|uniref:Uncharacterized protein n=1 Tax=Candidatus Riesia pediculischaeffi PTSU TaxID=1401651 RepID=A0A0C1V645_9ENTR|nr:hypothetical protein P689_12268 [Candidatus Riesia pediculischaeffi PTSU]
MYILYDLLEKKKEFLRFYSYPILNSKNVGSLVRRCELSR